MTPIVIVGLGGDPVSTLPPDVVELLASAHRVVTPSAEGWAHETLVAAGIEPTTLADLGLEPGSPAGAFVDAFAELAAEGTVAYVAAGYPLLREGMVSGLLARVAHGVRIVPAVSPMEVLLLAFDLDVTADLGIIDVKSLKPSIQHRSSHLIITGISSRLHGRMACERLSEWHSPDHRVVVSLKEGARSYALVLKTVKELAEIEITETSAIYVPPATIAPPEGFPEFVRLVAVLRAPDGCPWDRAQTHMSIRKNMIEEAYEAVSAIEAGDDGELADELGDVLLQVVLHAQMASEEDRFTIDDVIAGITSKIRRRHPHIFSDAHANTPDEVLAHWDRIKADEKSDAGKSVLAGIPDALPALMYAHKISRKAVVVGFEWETLEDVWDKVHEEIDELKQTEPGSAEAADEIGDLLFTIVNLARKQGIDAESALRGTCEKFKARFESMERAAATGGRDVSQLTLEEMETFWQDAKSQEKGPVT